MFKKRQSYIAKNIIVSLDFDGTIAHGLKAKLKYAKKWFGVNLSLEETKEKGFNNLMHKLGKQDVDYRTLMDPLNEKHIMEYEVPPNCLRSLRKLHREGFRFVVITSRNDHDFPYARIFIKRKFGELIEYLHNTRNESKDSFVFRLKPRIHIDDDLSKLRELTHTFTQLVYYRQPENRHKNMSVGDRGKIHEVDNWGDFYKIAHNLRELHEAVCWYKGWENNVFNLTNIHQFLRSLNIGETERLVEQYRKAV